MPRKDPGRPERGDTSESVPREERDRRRAKEGEEYRRRQAEASFRGRREGRARLENAAPPQSSSGGLRGSSGAEP